MKIIQLPRRFVQSDWGGTETFILETSKQLINAGHKTEILCPKMLTSIESELINNIEVNRVPYFYPYFGLGKNEKVQLDKKAGNAFSFSLLHKLFTIKELDIIHLHTGKRIGGIARTIAKLRNIPYVVSLHGGIFDVPQVESQSWTNPTKKTLEWGKILGAMTGSRRVLQDAAAIICVGYNEYKAIKEIFPGKIIFYLPNGVDCNRFNRGNSQRFRDAYKIPVNRKILLNIGRIDPQKNQISLIHALPELIHQYDDIHLVLIGPITDS